MRRWLCLPLLVTAALTLPAMARGHDVDVTSVARVFFEQMGERRYALSIVDLKVPPLGDLDRVLPGHCTPLSGDAGVRGVRGFAFECERPLTFDDTLRFPWSLSGVVVVASWQDGTDISGYFRGDGRGVSVNFSDLRAGAGSPVRLASRYFGLGGEHILTGFDHLLFVLGLLLLVRGFWPLVKTVTAFTVAHSITLGAAVLGVIPTASGPVEAAIALSIVLLAREVVTGHRGDVHLVHRQPWLVAFLFGLLHGLGFAGALSRIGLPGGDIPLALLFFNLGVEGGQLLFVVILLGANEIVRRIGWIRSRRLQPVVGYALGTLAMLWFFERLPAVWGG